MAEIGYFASGNTDEGFYVEYLRRNGPFSMTSNHFHPYYELYVLMSGDRQYFIRDRTYRVESGDLVLVGKHELHKTLDGRSHDHERLLVHFSDSYVHALGAVHARWLLAPFHRDVKVLRPESPERVLSAAERIVRELQEQTAGSDLALKLAAFDLLLIAGRLALADEPKADSAAAPQERDKTTDIVRYINESFAEPLSLGRLAERFFVSPWHLSRIFKAATGFTLTDYINLTRIKEAQRLLRETDRSITDIAASVGFDNFSHFGKTFKTIARLTPRDYRKTAKL